METSECPDCEDLQGNTCFGCKEDGSIDGKEFVSPVLSSDAGLEAIEDFCRQAERFAVDSKCGFHLHLDVGACTTAELKRVVLAYLLTEKLWHAFVPKMRRDNQYCKPLGFDADAIDNTDGRYEVSRLSADRYRWCNVWAISAHSTIEIRLHSATLEAEKICNWVKVHTRFVDWATRAADRQIAALDGLDLAEQFAQLRAIVGRELADFYLVPARKFGTELTPRRLLEAA